VLLEYHLALDTALSCRADFQPPRFDVMRFGAIAVYADTVSSIGVLKFGLGGSDFENLQLSDWLQSLDQTPPETEWPPMDSLPYNGLRFPSGSFRSVTSFHVNLVVISPRYRHQSDGGVNRTTHRS
jgi:hypothetical protein